MGKYVGFPVLLKRYQGMHLQAQFMAKAMGMHHSTFSRYIHGERKAPRGFKQQANRILDSVASLLQLEEEKSNE